MPNSNVQGLCDGDDADATLQVICKQVSVLRRADISAKKGGSKQKEQSAINEQCMDLHTSWGLHTDTHHSAFLQLWMLDG